MVRIHVLAFQGCTALAPVGFVDLLRKAHLIAQQSDLGRPVQRVEVKLVSGGAHQSVRAAGGLRLQCDTTIRDVRQSDLVLVPPLDEAPLDNLELNRAVIPWIQRMYRGGADVASACTGTFVLAEAGMLTGRSATTHWVHQDLLRSRYPRIQVEGQAVLVNHGRVCTAGGATSFLSLIVLVIERLYGPAVARVASRMFLIESGKAPQSAYEMFHGQMAHGDEQILHAQQRMEQDLREAPSVGELAQTCAMSRRNFVRRFKQATGNSPHEYILRLRVEAAKRALEGTGSSVSAVAEKVGYGDAVAFRKIFLRATGMTPRDYRQRFGAMGPPTVLTLQRRSG